MDFICRTFSSAIGISLVGVACVVFIWINYFCFSLYKNRSTLAFVVYFPYILYSLFICVWILLNAYFQLDHLIYYSHNVAKNIAVMANIVSFFAFASAYLFSCRLISVYPDKRISGVQWFVFFAFVIYAGVVNFIPGGVVKDVCVESVGKFTILFGRISIYFFLSIVALLVLALINFYIYNKKSLRIEQVKSAYMILGVIIFMTSTVISHLVIPIFYEDFSLVWLPPLLSVFESLLVGYALLCHRFYSLRYISFIGVSYIINCLIYITPLYCLKIMTDVRFYAWFFLLIAVPVVGLGWPKTLKFIKVAVSRVLYGMVGNPVENIFNLVKEFKSSIGKAMRRLNLLLDTDGGKIQKIGKDSTSQAFILYFEKEKVILKDEIEYLMKMRSAFDYNTVKVIRQQMEDGGLALVLPIFEKENKISHIYTVSNKNDNGFFSYEEIGALQRLFECANQYIYAEDQVRISQVLAGSIAHEIRNPLAKIQHHFETIDADIFGGDDAVEYKPLPENMKKIYKEVIDGKNAVQLGTKFIDVMLSEFQGTYINQSNFRYFSAKNMIIQALKEFSFKNKRERERIHLLYNDDDFIFKGSDTCFSFIIFNLLNNALYYFDDYKDSCVEIRIILGVESNTILFRDTGPGVDKNIIGSIFDQSFTFGKACGNGLGLAYCRRVMSAFEGSISCKSVLGEFTEFSLNFPAAPEDDIFHNTKNKLKRLLSAKHCLLIGDDQAATKTKEFLSQLGVNVVSLESAEKALQLLTEKFFDFIFICNYILEREYVLLKKMRTEAFDASVRVIPIIRFLSTNMNVSLQPETNITQGFIDVQSGWKHFILTLNELFLQGCLTSLRSLIDKRVLIVDDVKTNRMLLQYYLQANGIVTIHAENGKMAVDMAKDGDYDLIFMDIQMPVMNGIEATKFIRRIKNNFPIIALTADESKSVIDDINIHMDDYMMKPVSRRQLQEKLYKWMQPSIGDTKKMVKA